jgi:hypothetical protein
LKFEVITFRCFCFFTFHTHIFVTDANNEILLISGQFQCPQLNV